MNKLILNFKSKDSKKIKNPKNFLGGKGANLSEMGRMGLPVPPGFTISTKVCEVFYKDKKKLNSKLINQIKKYYSRIDNDENFEQSLSVLAGAKNEVFEFFDNVKVNEENEDLRKNRLELINMLCKTFQNFINFHLVKANNE